MMVMVCRAAGAKGGNALKQRKKQMWRRLTGLLLTVGMFTNLATGAWAINQPGAEVIDASQKTSETVLSQALQKDLTLTDAEALLALGDYLPDRLLVKVAPGAGIEEDLQTGEVLASQVLLESSDSFAEPGTWLALEVEDYHGLANLMVELGNQEDVLAVEPDYEISLPAEPQLAKSETEKQQTLQLSLIHI